MGRTVRDRKIDSRTARHQLPVRNAPYWCTIGRGRALGYRRGQAGGSWLAKYRAADGTRHQKLVGPADDVLDCSEAPVLDFDAAQKAARAWFELLDAHRGKRPRRYTVNQALDDYLEAFTGKSKDKTAWALDRYIRPALGSHEVSELTSEQLSRVLLELATRPAEYRASRSGKRKLRPEGERGSRPRRASANRIFAMLKAALNRAYSSGAIASDDAWRKVRPFPKVDAPRVSYLSPTEAIRVVTAASAEFRALVQAALLTGARWSELCRMRVRDVDLVAGVIVVPETKAGRPRHIHLSDEGIHLFRQLCRSRATEQHVFLNQHGRPYGTSHQVRLMRDACLAAEVNHVGFHILRHTYGSRLAMAGVPMAVIAEALGHSDERITRKHYAHLCPSYVRDSIRAGLGRTGLVEVTSKPMLRVV